MQDDDSKVVVVLDVIIWSAYQIQIHYLHSLEDEPGTDNDCCFVEKMTFGNTLNRLFGYVLPDIEPACKHCVRIPGIEKACVFSLCAGMEEKGHGAAMSKVASMSQNDMYMDWMHHYNFYRQF